MVSRILCAAVIVAVTVACGTSPESELSDAGTWVGTVTTAGDVTTVINESGSVWGGAATLVEEMSIGVESGPQEYMFGRVGAVYATDERIYLIDSQVPAVRMYDHEGTHVGDLGRSGQGPGEYTSPSLLAVDERDRVFVFDSRLGRINVYGPEGENLDPWPLTSSRCCVWPMYPLTEDALWVPVRQRVDRPGVDAIYGVQAVGPEGPYDEVTWLPDLDFEQATWTTDSGFEIEAPFSARLLWNPAPGGRLLVGGSDRFRFEAPRRPT